MGQDLGTQVAAVVVSGRLRLSVFESAFGLAFEVGLAFGLAFR
jgi:hypothetical protein